MLLLSGGLDSTLAGKLLLGMGVEVEAINFVSPFCLCTPKSLGCPASKRAAEQLGIPVTVIGCGEDYLEVIKHPRFGRGSGVNPCIDCRIFMFTRAKREMEERGADFVATGEVLGERPMSQRLPAMEIIERESGLSGRVVRPLSGRLLRKSLPEQDGLIEREQLAGIQGRSRKEQIALAERFGIKDYLCPAGGCLLTDGEYAARFRELLSREPDFGVADARLLRVGRHYRLPSGAKVVVGRDEGENAAIERAFGEGDALLLPRRLPGPSVLCRRNTGEGDVRTAAEILAAYMKKASRVDIEVRENGKPGTVRVIAGVQGGERERYEDWRVHAGNGKAAGAEVKGRAVEEGRG